MSLIEELEKEVADNASQMTVEVVLLLIDKMEDNIQRAWDSGKLQIPDLLNHYVRLKIMLHHVRKAWDRGWSSLTDEQFKNRFNDLNGKIKEARRKYYVSKLRYDESAEHASGCPCRGCRCLGRSGWGNSFTIGQGSD